MEKALELLSIAGSLNSTQDLDYLLQKIGLAAERLLDSEASSIMLVSEDKKNLYFKVASGEGSKALKKMMLPLGKGIAGHVAQSRQPEVVNNTRADPRFAGAFDKASGFVTRSLLCVPMVFRGELVGVVEVLNKRAGQYEAGHVGLLSGLASLASVAITNTRIIQEQMNFFSHVLEVLVGVIETSKPGMEGHPPRASHLACAMGKVLGMEEHEYRGLYYAGMLHDIGYVGMKNARVLQEMGILSAAEEEHPKVSAKMLGGIAMLSASIPMILHHHENFDGTGYPSKLKGGDIPLGARILCLVEAVEEVRRTGLRGEGLKAAAKKEAKAGSGTRFDPQIVEAFEAAADQEGVWD